MGHDLHFFDLGSDNLEYMENKITDLIVKEKK